jgi:hypothetical protein
MKRENIDSIFNLIRSEDFRAKPAMFMGRLSILGFGAYIAGYRNALWIHKIEEENNIFNDTAFGNFVAEYYKRPAQAGWANNIWAENSGDEPQSFKNFFRLFDEFIGEKKDEEYYENLLSFYGVKIN